MRLGTGCRSTNGWSENKRKVYRKSLGNHMIEFNHPWFKRTASHKSGTIIDYVKVSIEGETTANLLLNKADNDFQNLSPQELLNWL